MPPRSLVEASAEKLELAQIESALDLTARLVVELAVAEQIVDFVSLSLDQGQLDLVVHGAGPAVAVVAIDAVPGVPQAILVMGPQAVDEFRRKMMLVRQGVEALQGGFDSAFSGRVFLTTHYVILVATGLGEAQGPDHQR